MKLYHATAEKNLDSIFTDGMKPNSYWTSSIAILDYYIETIKDDDDIPVVLVIDLSMLNENSILPDYNGLYEPITSVLGMSEEEIINEWHNNSNKTWKDSLELIYTVQYEKSIKPSLLHIDSE